MKQGRTIVELAQEIQRQASSKSDYIAPSAALRIHSNGTSKLAIGEAGEFGVASTAHSQLATYTGIPKNYYDVLREQAPQLLDLNVNHWLDQNGSQKRLVRTLDGNVRALLSDRYRRLDNLDLMEQILPTLQEMPGLEFKSCEVTEHRLYLKLTTPRLQAEVKVNDVVQGGILISNSEIGSGALSVQPFSERLWCLNGAVHTEFGKRKAHLGRIAEGDGEGAREFYTDETLAADDKAFFLGVRDTVKGILTAEFFGKIADGMREAAGITIKGDPSKAVEKLAKTYRLPDTERGSILEHLIKGSDLSMWGLANAITAAAQDADTYDRATEMETLGGSLMTPSAAWGELVAA